METIYEEEEDHEVSMDYEYVVGLALDEIEKKIEMVEGWSDRKQDLNPELQVRVEDIIERIKNF